MLLIYWLRTKERSFQYGRPVYNSLSLVSEDEKDNLLLQMLASEALKDWEKFAEKLDSFVKWDQDNEHGFKVEESQLLEYIQNQKSKNLDNADKNKFQIYNSTLNIKMENSNEIFLIKEKLSTQQINLVLKKINIKVDYSKNSFIN